MGTEATKIRKVNWNFLIPYILFWGLMPFVIPERLVEYKPIMNFSNFMASYIPSIRGYASNSSSPDLILFIASIQWLLVPVYIFFLINKFLSTVILSIQKDKGKRMGIRPFFLLIGCLMMAFSFVYLPQEVKLRSDDIRLGAVWDNLMHDYIFITAVSMAVFSMVFSWLVLYIIALTKYLFIGGRDYE